jgi:cell division septation protein DedD
MIVASLLLASLIFGIIHLELSNRFAKNNSVEIPVIEAVSPIKIRPPKERQIIPYQDELIYGKLDNEDNGEDDGGEHILPTIDFAPEISISDVAGIADEHKSGEEGTEIAETGAKQEEEELGTLDDLQYLNYADPKQKTSGQIDANKSIAIAKAPGAQNQQQQPKSVVPQHKEHAAAMQATTMKQVITAAKAKQQQQTRAQNSRQNQATQQAKAPAAQQTKAPTTQQTRTPAAQQTKTPAAQQTKALYLPLGNFSSSQKATSEITRLRSKHAILRAYNISIRIERLKNRDMVYNVFVGPFNKEDEMRAVRRAIGR